MKSLFNLKIRKKKIEILSFQEIFQDFIKCYLIM